MTVSAEQSDCLSSKSIMIIGKPSTVGHPSTRKRTSACQMALRRPPTRNEPHGWNGNMQYLRRTSEGLSRNGAMVHQSASTAAENRSKDGVAPKRQTWNIAICKLTCITFSLPSDQSMLYALTSVTAFYRVRHPLEHARPRSMAPDLSLLTEPRGRWHGPHSTWQRLTGATG